MVSTNLHFRVRKQTILKKSGRSAADHQRYFDSKVLSQSSRCDTNEFLLKADHSHIMDFYQIKQTILMKIFRERNQTIMDGIVRSPLVLNDQRPTLNQDHPFLGRLVPLKRIVSLSPHQNFSLIDHRILTN